MTKDDPSLTVRLCKGRNPQPVVLDSSLSCPATARLVSPLSLLCPYPFPRDSPLLSASPSLSTSRNPFSIKVYIVHWNSYAVKRMGEKAALLGEQRGEGRGAG